MASYPYQPFSNTSDTFPNTAFQMFIDTARHQFMADMRLTIVHIILMRFPPLLERMGDRTPHLHPYTRALIALVIVSVACKVLVRKPSSNTQ